MDSLKPFLKWPGGKRWLVPYVRRIIGDQRFEDYFEPFVGGGAMFFAVRPWVAVISDINPDLINTYQQVKLHPRELVEKLQALPVSKEKYLELRASRPTHPLEVAVRFLYLNRTAFGGMYRLNKKGQFNVPYGGGERTPEPLWTHNLLEDAATALRNATIMVADFQDALGTAHERSLVYCDPTYTTAHNNNGFIRYNEENFSWADQKRLARVCTEAAERGATVLVSNAYHAEVRDLYPAAEVHTVYRWDGLCPTPSKRRAVREYLLVLRPLRAASCTCGY